MGEAQPLNSRIKCTERRLFPQDALLWRVGLIDGFRVGEAGIANGRRCRSRGILVHLDLQG
jgi:hypothetical protein